MKLKNHLAKSQHDLDSVLRNHMMCCGMQVISARRPNRTRETPKAPVQRVWEPEHSYRSSSGHSLLPPNSAQITKIYPLGGVLSGLNSARGHTVSCFSHSGCGHLLQRKDM